MAQTAAAIVKNGDSGKWRENCEAECSNRVALYLRVAGGDGREGEGSGCVRKGIEAGPKESVKMSLVWPGDPVVKALPSSNPGSAVPSLVRKCKIPQASEPKIPP